MPIYGLWLITIAIVNDHNRTKDHIMLPLRRMMELCVYDKAFHLAFRYFTHGERNKNENNNKSNNNRNPESFFRNIHNANGVLSAHIWNN